MISSKSVEEFVVSHCWERNLLWHSKTSFSQCMDAASSFSIDIAMIMP
jgi:hypothetical protein